MRITFTGNDNQPALTKSNVIRVHRKANYHPTDTGERTAVHYPHTCNDRATSAFYEGESLLLRPEFGELR